VNLANISVLLGLLTVAFTTMPYGIVILVALFLLWRIG
jgi:hypothetical protein